MAKFDRFIQQILGENIPPVAPPTQQNNQAAPDLSKMTPEQLKELIDAANNPNKTLSNNHPLFQTPQQTNQTSKPGSPASVAQTPTTQSNAANQQTNKTA